MPRRPARICQADIARALRAAEQAGVRVIIEITAEGTIRLIPATHSPSLNGSQAPIEPQKEIVL